MGSMSPRVPRVKKAMRMMTSPGLAIANIGPGKRSDRAPLWLVRQDSNLGIADSKHTALPLGDAPREPGGPGPYRQCRGPATERALLGRRPCASCASILSDGGSR